MKAPRADLVVSGDVVVAATPAGLETVEAIGIGGGRVVAAGRRDEVADVAGPGARFVDAEGVVVPGLHDAHLHLAGLARHRVEVALDGAPDFAEIVERVATAARRAPPDAWVLGRGWTERTMDRSSLEQLDAACDGRRAWLSSHDGHSAWVSSSALELAGVGVSTADPPGGRIERRSDGTPNGILRETARDLVEPVVVRPRGEELAPALSATLDDLASLGLTGATDMGAYTTDKGRGRYAGLGDDFSAIAELFDDLDGRLRLALGFPASALLSGAVQDAELTTGAALGEGTTVRVGWAKAYADGALGSRTAALFAPYTCGDADDRGILRLEPDVLDEIAAAAREARVALAVHAIGDRTVAAVLDALERAGPPAEGVPPDRIEHAQLVRPIDRLRFAALNVLASMQPIHAPADRSMVEECWAGREENAYAIGTLAASGARLVFGSDAPVESVNPWHGVLAAVRRRLPGEPDPGWRPEEGIDIGAALFAYTLAPAAALGSVDVGHLWQGAAADLAVLDIGLDALREAGDELAGARSVLTLVGGREVYRS
jgi:predicted amidohydrolase YtcJ